MSRPGDATFEAALFRVSVIAIAVGGVLLAGGLIWSLL